MRGNIQKKGKKQIRAEQGGADAGGSNNRQPSSEIIAQTL